MYPTIHLKLPRLSVRTSLLLLCVLFLNLVALIQCLNRGVSRQGAAPSPSYKITDLGTLGGSYSIASGINNVGQVVGTSYTVGNFPHAFLYDPSNPGMQDISPSSVNAQAFAINDSGQIVGVDASSPNPVFIWQGGGITYIDGNDLYYAVCINNLGQVAGSGANGHAYIWSTGAPLKDLRTLPNTVNSVPNGINDSGVVVGDSNFDTGQCNYDAFLYNGSMQGLPSLGGTYSQANAVNQAGKATGYSGTDSTTCGSSHAFFYDGSIHDLGTLPGDTDSFAYGINNKDQVVGESDGNAENAVLWSNGQTINLNTLISDSTWQLLQAFAINDAGQIVGFGFHNGQTRAFLMTPIGPTITISKVSLPDQNDIQSDDLGQLPFCSGANPNNRTHFPLPHNDVLHWELSTTNANGYTAHWSVSSPDGDIFPSSAA